MIVMDREPGRSQIEQVNRTDLRNGKLLLVQFTADALSRLQISVVRDDEAENAIAKVANRSIKARVPIGKVSMHLASAEEGAPGYDLTDLDITGFVRGDGVDRFMIKGDWYLGVNENGIWWPVPVMALERLS